MHATHVAADAAPLLLLARPASHATQLPAASADHVPGAHMAQDTEPSAAANRPAAHSLHTADDVAPLLLLARPASHATQLSTAPVDHVPGAHMVHESDPGPANRPLSHSEHVDSASSV